jgi:N-succinyldiaminopimelate aminotransferase
VDAALRWEGFSESRFSSVTRRARQLDAVNLAQGCPDFPGPAELIQLIGEQLKTCPNQYAPGMGAEVLLKAIAEFRGSRLDAEVGAGAGGAAGVRQICLVTAGATEGIFCVIQGLVNPGDRVLCFEPFYESYRAAVAAAGGVFVPVRLNPPDLDLGADWEIDWPDFEAASSLPFRCMILNTPHNPTGFILNHDHFDRIFGRCRLHGAAVVSDEVYEHLVYDEEHLSVLDAVPDSERDRCVRVSSIAKTLGFTGFKIGWIQGSAAIVAAAARVHEAIMFCVPMATQLGVAAYLADEVTTKNYLLTQAASYLEKRKRLIDGLLGIGFEIVSMPPGSYFVSVSARQFVGPGERDFQFCDRLINEARVAALPLSGFCLPEIKGSQSGSMGTGRSRRSMHPVHHLPWIRVAFCKRDETIDLALENLSKWRSSFRPAR